MSGLFCLTMILSSLCWCNGGLIQTREKRSGIAFFLSSALCVGVMAGLSKQEKRDQVLLSSFLSLVSLCVCAVSTNNFLDFWCLYVLE